MTGEQTHQTASTERLHDEHVGRRRVRIQRNLLHGRINLAERTGQSHRRPDDFGATRIRAEMERDGTAGIVTHLSALDTASLQALYRHASCLLYLSLAEGFGLPLIEAMSMGTPLIASNRTSITEVVGNDRSLAEPKYRRR